MISLDKKLFAAQGTIMRQAAAGITTLSLGMGFIALLVLGGNQILAYFYLDVDSNDLWISGFFASFGLVVLLVTTTIKQFEEALIPSEIFHLSLKYGLWIGVAIFAFFFLTTICVSLSERELFLWSLFPALFILLLSILLGLLTGIVHACRLKLEKFDPQDHQDLIANKADLLACKYGILPYRHRVMVTWQIVFFTGLALFFIAFPIMNWGDFDGIVDCLLLLMFIGLGLYLIYKIGEMIELFNDPKIKFIEGYVIATLEGKIGPSYYQICCQGKNFRSDSLTWMRVSPYTWLRIWYTPLGNRALAYEDLKAHADPEPSQYKTTTYDPALVAMFKNKQSNRSRWLGALGCLTSIVLVVNWLWNRR